MRAISCEGTQIACADDAALGAGEIVEFEVFANEELWLFVDGFNGSVGSYTLELDFTP